MDRPSGEDMEKKHPIKEEICLVADHIRLLATLLTKRTDLEASDKSALVQVMHDLADRLDQLNGVKVKRIDASLTGRDDRL
jgi:hypothetical protein